MSTPCTIKFYETLPGHDMYLLLALYKNCDGYPSAIGKQIYNFLKDIEIIKGIGINQSKLFKYANGMSDLALQFVLKFKDNVGDLYATYNNDIGDWNYEIEYLTEHDTYQIEVWNRYEPKPIQFFGTLQEFGTWLESGQNAV